MSRHLALALAVVGVLGLSVTVRADTTVGTSGSWDGDYKTLDYVLGAAYGYSGQGTGSVSTSLGWNPGGTSITFTRVADGGSTISLFGPPGGAGDSIWSDGTPTFHVSVRYADQGQTLGWTNLVDNTSHDILTVTGSGLNPSFTYAVGAPPTTLSSMFTWYDRTGNYLWSSDPANNGVGNPDHMVTYWVTGQYANGTLVNNGLGAYVICFEDLPLASSDIDYNDLVVQVSAIPVPLPAALWPGLAMLGGLGAWRAMRRRSRGVEDTR